MKKAIAMLLMLAMTLCAAGAMAAEVYYNEGYITYVYDDIAKMVRVKECDTAATSVAISAKITVDGVDYSVTSIMKDAFSGCTNLKSVTFSGMEPPTFADNLFIDCGALQKIYVPEGSEEDYKNALAGQYVSGRSCASMVEGYFEITDGVLTKYNGPGGSVVIPNSVTSIGNEAFKDCTSLTSVTIPSSVTSIGEKAFWNCESLTRVTIPSSVTSIGNFAFADCTSLTSVTIPSSVKSIGIFAFYTCTNLTSVTIPSSVKSIGEYAFYNCESLTSVTIPEGVTSIGREAFYGCKNLTSVTIPSSVKIIEAGAFLSCTGLTSVTFRSTNPPDFGDNLFLFTDLQTIYVPEGSEADYKKKLKDQYTDGKIMADEGPCDEMVVGYALPQPAAAADLPRTGDHSSLALWVALLAISGVGMTMRRREA